MSDLRVENPTHRALPARRSPALRALTLPLLTLPILTPPILTPHILTPHILAALGQPRLLAGDPVKPPPQPAPAAAAPGIVSVPEYQARLRALAQLVAQCQSAMTPANCPSSQVGPDVQLALPSGPRQIRFAWLRNVLDAASDSQKDSAKSKAKSPPSGDESAPSEPSAAPDFQLPPLPQQLAHARQRLADDAELAATWSQQSAVAGKEAPSSPRHALDRILAAREYHPAVAGPSLLDRAFEKIGNWIDNIIGKLEQAGFKSKWVGRTAEILFVLALTAALVWFFIRLERQGRLALAQIGPGPGGGAASARDWQLWLEDARRAAAQSAWRDAIHLLYWASISRLEGLGLWPADRARTPREYLALLTQENAHHADLKALTRSFERTWYAGRPAEESDFRLAADLAARLGIPAPQNRGVR